MKTFPADSLVGGGSPPTHPVAACLDAVAEALREVADTRCWSLSSEELAALVRQAGQVAAGVEELRLRLIAAADVADVGALNGATSTAAWLAHADRMTRQDAVADVAVATALDTRCEATRRALALAAVNPAQALVITKAVTDLPATVGDGDRARAEAWLLE